MGIAIRIMGMGISIGIIKIGIIDNTDRDGRVQFPPFPYVQ